MKRKILVAEFGLLVLLEESYRLVRLHPKIRERESVVRDEITIHGNTIVRRLHPSDYAECT